MVVTPTAGRGLHRNVGLVLVQRGRQQVDCIEGYPQQQQRHELAGCPGPFLAVAEAEHISHGKRSEAERNRRMREHRQRITQGCAGPPSGSAAPAPRRTTAPEATTRTPKTPPMRRAGRGQWPDDTAQPHKPPRPAARPVVW